MAFCICAVLCALALASAFSGVSSGGKLITVKKQVYYAVSVYSFSDESQAKAKKSEVASMGGAGYVYSADKKSYVLTSAYETSADAKSVAENIGIEYKSEVIEIVLPKVKVEKEKKEAYELLKNIAEFFLRTSISFDKGEISKIQAVSLSLPLIASIDEETLKLESSTKEKDVQLKLLLKSIKANMQLLISETEFGSFFKYTGLNCICLMQNHFTCNI